MKVIIGLGNPGVKYRFTRHNIGFLLIDQFIEPDELKSYKTYLCAEKKIKEETVLFIKPTTFMNLSGSAYLELFHHYPDLEITDTLVVFDDCHLQLGKIRFRERGSAAGHNGIKDIISKLNTNEFPRLKFGIDEAKGDLIEHVLGDFTRQEEELLNQTIAHSEEAILEWISSGTKICMNKFN